MFVLLNESVCKNLRWEGGEGDGMWSSKVVLGRWKRIPRSFIILSIGTIHLSFSPVGDTSTIPVHRMIPRNGGAVNSK